MNRKNVAVMIFEDVEVLDFAGPYEVFSRVRTVPGGPSRWNDESAPFNVFTVAKTDAPLKAIGGLQVTPDYSFANAPGIDLLVVPGGLGARHLVDDVSTIEWIKSVAQTAEQTTSVCTGSLLLAKAGLLKNRTATTHWGALELLGSIDPSITVDAKARYVDDVIVTSAGVSAGIDMAFHVVEQHCGEAVANDTARYIDYPRC
jgi:transcriptional regulator GlxA family with amidase domain